MTRVILMTFGVLGWAWYELSGGADFQPGQHGVQLMASVPAALESNIVDAPDDEQLGALARKIPADNPEPQVTRLATSGAVLNSVGAAQTTPVVLASPIESPSLYQELSVASVAAASDPLNSISAVVVRAAIEEAALNEAVRPDYRQVSGSRVNLRSGPGTSFGVVAQLVRDEKVEMLGTKQGSWVELRSLDGNEIGWMSENFLKLVN